MKAYQVHRKIKIRALLIVARVSCNINMVQFNMLFAGFDMSLDCIASCTDTIWTYIQQKLYKLKTKRVPSLQGDT
jgi:hypothetical protein